MADNARTSLGTNDGVVFATDDVGGVHFPRIKLDNGADGISGGDVCTANPLPVTVPAAATSIAKAEDAAHASADVGVMALSVRKDTAAATSGTDGDYQPLITDVNGRLHAITSSAVDHDASAIASVNQVGLEARNTEPTPVSATGDAVRALASMLGKQITLPYAIPASTWSYAAATSGITNTSDVAAVAAGGASVRHYITGVQVFNAHATVGTEVVIKDGSTIIWRGYAVAVGGGCSAKFDPPLRGTANTAVNVANITTGSATYFNLQGFDAKE